MECVIVAHIEDNGTKRDFAMVADLAFLLNPNGTVRVNPAFHMLVDTLKWPRGWVHWRAILPDGAMHEGVELESCGIKLHPEPDGSISVARVIFDLRADWQGNGASVISNGGEWGHHEPQRFAIYRKEDVASASDFRLVQPLTGQRASYWWPAQTSEMTRKSERVRTRNPKYYSAGFGPMFSF